MGASSRRWRQPLVLAGVVGILVVPVVLDSDDFPLSTYPMYSRTRPAEVDFVTAQAVRSDGTVVALGLGASAPATTHSSSPASFVLPFERDAQTNVAEKSGVG